jgi:hypothetical protein
MLFDAISKLFDGCIQLLKLRKENRRNLLVDHVAPVYADFEALHKDYLSSFDGYRQTLKSTTAFDSPHPIFDQIIKDHVFTQGLRGKLVAMGKMIPANSASYHMDSFDMFMLHIQHYFIWSEKSVTQDSYLGLVSNDPRSCLISGLRFIFHLDQFTVEEAVCMLRDKSCIWFIDRFALTFFNSEGRRMQVLSELESAKRDLNSIKRSLSIALVDSIVETNQWSYQRATEEYLKMRNELV